MADSALITELLQKLSSEDPSLMQVRKRTLQSWKLCSSSPAGFLYCIAL